MWNTQYTVPTMVLLIIISAAFLGRKRLPIRLNAIFAGLLVTDFLTMIADFVSTCMDEAAGFPAPALWLANYLFFGLFIARSFYFFEFADELVGGRRTSDTRRSIHGLAEALFILEQGLLLVGSIKGWIFSIEDGAYVAGPAYGFINVQFIVWILLALASTATTRPRPGIRKSGIYAYLLILLVGVLMRMALTHMVIMNLFCLFAIQVIYLLYLNPDQFLDPRTLTFNRTGWDRMIDEAVSHDGFHMAGFGIRSFSGLQQVRGTHQVDEGLARVGAWLHTAWPRIPAYYLGNGIFILASERPFGEKDVLASIEQRFSGSWINDQGTYYLGINEVALLPGIHAGNDDAFKGALRDVFNRITQPEPVGLICVDDELLQKYRRSREVRQILTRALADDGLEMFLQPVVNTWTGRVEGAEALCRLPDGKGGYIFPDEFIPIALNAGTMDTLGLQMFRQACAFMSGKAAGRLDWVNVNVAPEQFKNPHLLDDFMGALEEYGLEPAQIHLEITEESMIDRALLHDCMARFREQGFVFSMDDFGSSYSNLIRLQQNHFSNVKIDRDFTWSYFREKTPLLPDIIRTCHDLGVQVIVEGVETKEMAEGVAEIGADYIQGYFFSKPIPVAEFMERFLRG